MSSSKPIAEDDDFSSLFNMQIQPVGVDLNTQRNILQFNEESETAKFETRKDQELFSKKLEASMKLIPDFPFDFFEYQPQNPADGPASYPKKPMMKLLTPEMMSSYDIHILFYIFYYFPNSPYQFFAAKELQKRDWEFCINSKEWVHRISEIYEINNEKIVAKFEIFDPEQEGWKIIVKNSVAISRSEFSKE